MARLPGRACRWPGCIEVTRDPSGYCEHHRTKARKAWSVFHDAMRGGSSERGYDSRWQRFRAWFLARHPLCERCGAVADTVHHLEPVDKRPDLRLVEANCQALCRNCHEQTHGRVGGQKSTG